MPLKSFRMYWLKVGHRFILTRSLYSNLWNFVATEEQIKCLPLAKSNGATSSNWHTGSVSCCEDSSKREMRRAANHHGSRSGFSGIHYLLMGHSVPGPCGHFPAIAWFWKKECLRWREGRFQGGKPGIRKVLLKNWHSQFILWSWDYSDIKVKQRQTKTENDRTILLCK